MQVLRAIREASTGVEEINGLENICRILSRLQVRVAEPLSQGLCPTVAACRAAVIQLTRLCLCACVEAGGPDGHFQCRRSGRDRTGGETMNTFPAYLSA